MIRTGKVGLAAPRVVHACTVRNASPGDVYVRILYEPVRTQSDDSHERRVEFQLIKGAQLHIDEEEFNMGSYTIREVIRTVEVTRANGRVDEISAPFNKVDGVELNWLFIVEAAVIQSVKPGSG
jgi:hypothetical protein